MILTFGFHVVGDIDRKNKDLESALNRLKDLEKGLYPRTVIILASLSSWGFCIRIEKNGCFQTILELVANQQQDTALAKDAQQMLRSVDSVIAKQELQNLLNNENWQQVSNFVAEQEKLGNLPLTKEIFGIWVKAETKQENWSRVLELMGDMQSMFPEEAAKVDSLLAQGEAAEKLGGWVKARVYYEQALAKLPAKDSQKECG